MNLPLTLTMAAAAGLINLWLAIRIGQVRTSQKVSVGDGGNEFVIRRMRAQANFVEYAPFVLILMGLIELSGGSSFWLWVLGGAFIVARIGHGWGMMWPAPNIGRAGGAIGTWAILALLAGWGIGLVYTAQAKPVAATTVVRIDR